MLLGTDPIKNEDLESITVVLAYPTVLCFHKWGYKRGTTGSFLVPCTILTRLKNC